MSKIRKVCVYCGSGPGADPAFAAAARALGKILAQNKVRLVFGGGAIGLMGEIADAVLDHGGEVTGIIPEFLMDKEASKHSLSALTEVIVTRDMHERKHKMFEQSDAFVTLPGGIGTLEEFFEVLSWRTLGLHSKPIVIIDQGGYWQPLAALLRGVVEGGFAEPTHLDHVAFIKDLDELLPTIAAMPRSAGFQKRLDRI